MKLYYCPGACSLAGHIALHEVGQPFSAERVDLRSHQTAGGQDFFSVTAKGYVPALAIDGELVTENIAVLDYLAGRFPQLGLDGALGRTRLLEALAYISTEIHKSYKPFWKHASDDEKAAAADYIVRRMELLAGQLGDGDYLFGDRPSVADLYLFVTLLWAERFGIDAPAPLKALADRLKARPAVAATLAAEGLA